MGSPLLLRLDNQVDDEKKDGPKALLDNPAAGRVSEPDLRRLLRSVSTGGAAAAATEVAE